MLVVDMQNDFLDGAGYYARRAALEERTDWGALSRDELARLLHDSAHERSRGPRSQAVASVIANTCAAIAAARAADRPIAFVRAVYDRSFEMQPPLLSKDPDRTHFPCKPETWGSEFVREVAEALESGGRASERLIEKHTYDAFSSPVLEPFLEESRVASVVVCGTETQVCVMTTAQHAALLGFRTFILEDCVWSANGEMAAAALSIFGDAFGEVITLHQLRAGA